MNLTDLEREIRATLTEAGEQAHTIEDLATKATRPIRRRRTWLASAVPAASIAAIATTIAVTTPDKPAPATATTPSPTARPIAIPTSSWKPGDGALQALRSGILKATPEGCPYLISPDPRATDRTVLIWPTGYTARYTTNNKIEIVAPNGSVVVHEGDTLSVGGGLLPTSPKPCTLGAKNAFVVMEDLTH
jgi:hypothetical protein